MLWRPWAKASPLGAFLSKNHQPIKKKVKQMNSIEFKVGGSPLPKGSTFGRIRGWPNDRWNKAAREKAMKRILGVIYSGAHPIIDIMPTVKGLNKWEQKIKNAARAAMAGQPVPFHGPCRVYLVFYKKRPSNHYGSRNKKPYLKDKYKNAHCTVYPDIDKLTRAIFDGMNQIVFKDDAQVVDVCSRKRWGKHAGVWVKVEELPEHSVNDLPEMNQMLFNFGEDQ